MTHPIGQLAEVLRTGNLPEKRAAAEELAQLEDEARDAAVALVEACASDDEQLCEWTTSALEGLGPPPVDDVRQLAGLVGHASGGVAYWAATLLGRLETSAAPAVPELTAALNSHAELAARERAAWALGKIGPAASGARDALAQAADGSQPRLSRLAREALERVQ